MKLYFKAADRLWRVLAYLLAALLAVLVLIVFWQVICRFLLKDGTGWTGEAATLVFVWVTDLVAALAIHQGSQISMTLLVVRAGRPVRQVILLVQAVVCEVFYGVFTAAGIRAMQKFARVSTPALTLPMSLAYGAIAVSGAVMLLYGVGEILKPIMQLARPQAQSGEKEEGPCQ